MQHLGTQVLETNRLLLRKFNTNDCQSMFKNWCNDPRINKYVTWEAHNDIVLTKEITEKWVEGYKDKNFYQWNIILKDTNESIGSITVVDIMENNEEVEIGYCLGYNYWNKGIMTEAFMKVIEFLFQNVDVKKIIAKHDQRNIASGKVMEKCGMKFFKESYDTNKNENITLKHYFLEKNTI